MDISTLDQLKDLQVILNRYIMRYQSTDNPRRRDLYQRKAATIRKTIKDLESFGGLDDAS